MHISYVSFSHPRSRALLKQTCLDTLTLRTSQYNLGDNILHIRDVDLPLVKRIVPCDGELLQRQLHSRDLEGFAASLRDRYVERGFHVADTSCDGCCGCGFDADEELVWLDAGLRGEDEDHVVNGICRAFEAEGSSSWRVDGTSKVPVCGIAEQRRSGTDHAVTSVCS